jgi:hypothetical protein
MMAMLTAYDVIVHVPCCGLTERFPAIVGIDTFVIVVSRMFMNVASARNIVVIPSGNPESGGMEGAAEPGGGPDDSAILKDQSCRMRELVNMRAIIHEAQDEK